MFYKEIDSENVNKQKRKSWCVKLLFYQFLLIILVPKPLCIYA